MIFPVLLMAAEIRLDCANATAQSAMNICSGQEYNRADDALNAAWKAAARRVRPKGGLPRLRAAQHKWLAYRDAHCLEQAGPEDGAGSMRPMQYNMCLTNVTRARTLELSAIAADDR